MRVIVLGSAAGGGFPQWNSNAPGCRRARANDPAARRRTQASIAVSADGERWVVVNASPDLRQQIEATEALWPRSGLRSTPIAAVVLTGGYVDGIAGLLSLREQERFVVMWPAPVLDVLSGNPVFNVLDPRVVERRVLDLHRETALAGHDGRALGVSLEAFAVPGKVPLYAEDAALEARFERGEPVTDTGGGTVGLRIGSEAGWSLFYIPGCAAMTPGLARRLAGADAVLFDGTLWRDDEMPRAGLGAKTGRRMGHMSVSGPDGAMAAFAPLGVRRKVFIHINNSNPILLEDSAEHAAVRAAGWEVAFDGMEVAL